MLFCQLHVCGRGVYTAVRLLMGRTKITEMHDPDFYRALTAYKRRGVVHVLRVGSLAENMMQPCVKSLWWLDAVLGLKKGDDVPKYPRAIADVNVLERYMRTCKTVHKKVSYGIAFY